MKMKVKLIKIGKSITVPTPDHGSDDSHTLLDYIESDGNCYINLHLTPTRDKIFEWHGEASNSPFGCTNFTAAHTDQWYYKMFTSGGQSYGTKLAVLTKIIWNLTNLSIYDIAGKMIVTVPSTVAPSGDLWLFGRSDNQTMYASKFYKMKIGEHEFIPVLKNGVPCIYDKLDLTYFYKLGSGSLNYQLPQNID